MAVASLVLGIISVVIAVIFPVVGWIGIIVGIIGIILGVLGRKDPEKKGMATAGMVLSIIGVALSLLLFLACAACVSAVGTAAGANSKEILDMFK